MAGKWCGRGEWAGMDAFFLDKVAIVTGASSGIGRCVALALARAGARVVLAARRLDRLQEVAGDIAAQGGEALVIPTDVTRRDEVERLVGEAGARWNRLDILVASAGAYIRRPVRELSVEEIERSMAVNFYGGVYLALAALPHLLGRGRGHIILITSLDGKKGLPPDAPYVAAKFALTGFGEVLRQELHDAGIHVTTVLPGRVETPMVAGLRVPRISAKIPPEAVARAVVGALRRPRPEVIVPPHVRALVYLNTFSPRLGDWAVRRLNLSGWEVDVDARRQSDS